MSRPPSARAEAARGTAAYAAYLAVRRAVLASGGRRRAHRNAARVVAVERRLALDVESSVQRAAHRVPGIVHALHAGYMGAHILPSVGWLAWWVRRVGVTSEGRALGPWAVCYWVGDIVSLWGGLRAVGEVVSLRATLDWYDAGTQAGEAAAPLQPQLSAAFA